MSLSSLRSSWGIGIGESTTGLVTLPDVRIEFIEPFQYLASSFSIRARGSLKQEEFTLSSVKVDDADDIDLLMNLCSTLKFMRDEREMSCLLSLWLSVISSTERQLRYVHHFTWAAEAPKSGAPPSPQGASMAAQDPTASNHHSPASSTSRGQQISVSMASKQIREKPFRTTYDLDLGDGNHPSRTVQRGVAHSTDRPASPPPVQQGDAPKQLNSKDPPADDVQPLSNASSGSATASTIRSRSPVLHGSSKASGHPSHGQINSKGSQTHLIQAATKQTSDMQPATPMISDSDLANLHLDGIEVEPISYSNRRCRSSLSVRPPGDNIRSRWAPFETPNSNPQQRVIRNREQSV
ncbi:hypothetical protein ACLOJK_003920 [Asimina triloba]